VSSHSHRISLRSVLILYSNIHLGLTSGLFSSGFRSKIWSAFLFCPIHPVYSTHLILLYLTTLDNVTCISDLLTGYGLVNRFIGCSQVVSIINYITLKITVTITRKIKSSMSILNSQSCGTLSRTLRLDSVSHPELASRGPEIEHPVQQFIPLLFAVATKRVSISA
jgi:hypothetical protein